MKTNWIPYHLKQNEKLWPIIQDMLDKGLLKYINRNNVELRMTRDWSMTFKAKDFEKILQKLYGNDTQS